MFVEMVVMAMAVTYDKRTYVMVKVNAVVLVLQELLVSALVVSRLTMLMLVIWEIEIMLAQNMI